MAFCPKCGAKNDDGAVFCPKCGFAIGRPQSGVTPAAPYAPPIKQPVPPPPVSQPVYKQPVPPPPAAPVYRPPVAATVQRPDLHSPQAQGQQTQKKKKTKAPIFIVGGVVVAVLLILVISGVLFNSSKLPDVTYTYQKAGNEVDIDFETVDTIYPSLYNSMDSILNFTGMSDNGDTEVMVRVEVPGFTQVYEQKLTLTSQVTQVFVRPPILTGELDLSSAKDAQINFTVTDIGTGKPLLQETIPVTLMSIYDIQYWDDEFGIATRDNYLAFLTPESEGILELKRVAIDYLSYLTGGYMQSFVGYQSTGIFEYESDYTYYQALALQMAMSGMGVRYNSTPYSSSGEDYLQRVLLPDDVIASQSGLCVETASVMASALQSAGMHCMLVFPSGHCQVAVETWQDSGEYFLIETTYLPVDDYNIDYIVTYLTQDEWADYITYGNDGYGCYLVDCDYSTLLGLQALSN